MKLEEVYKRLKAEIGDKEFKIAEIRFFINGHAQDFRYFESMFSERVDLILKHEEDLIKYANDEGIFYPYGYLASIGTSLKDILYEERDSFKQFIAESVKRIKEKCVDNINTEAWEDLVKYLKFVFKKWVEN